MFTDSQFRFVQCDGPKCTKQGVLIETSDAEKTKKVMSENPWMNSPRVVTAGSKIQMTPQGPQQVPQQFLFCSDTCLVDAASAGMFISQAERMITLPDGSPDSAMRTAAQQKATLDAADAALRKGESVKIQVAR